MTSPPPPDGRPGYAIRPATAADLDQIGDVLGRAFDDDPVWGHVIRRRPVGPWAGKMLRIVAAVHLPHDHGPDSGHDHADHGSVLVAVDDESGRVLGVSIWAEPDHWRTSVVDFLPHIPTLLRIFGVRGLSQVRVINAMERAHPTAPHHYLAVLGTDPDHQGRGIGSALMAPVLARCDTEGLPAYLESSKEANLAFYARHGFETTGTLPLKDGPTMWFMWRPTKG